VIASERGKLTNSLSSAVDKARLLAVTAPPPHSGDWLYTLPLSSCRLRLNDSAQHNAVVFDWEPTSASATHMCPCGTMVDAKGMHGLSHKGGMGRSARHHGLKDLIWRALAKANIRAIKKKTVWSDVRQREGKTLIPWQNGKCVTWGVTVRDTLAPSSSGHIWGSRGCSRKKKKRRSTVSCHGRACSRQSPWKPSDQSTAKDSSFSATLEGASPKCQMTSVRAPIGSRPVNSVAIRDTFAYTRPQRMSSSRFSTLFSF